MDENIQTKDIPTTETNIIMLPLIPPRKYACFSKYLIGKI